MSNSKPDSSIGPGSGEGSGVGTGTSIDEVTHSKSKQPVKSDKADIRQQKSDTFVTVDEAEPSSAGS
jgi:hypothetical protein